MSKGRKKVLHVDNLIIKADHVEVVREHPQRREHQQMRLRDAGKTAKQGWVCRYSEDDRYKEKKSPMVKLHIQKRITMMKMEITKITDHFLGYK
ncbi:hypothetical protein [Paracerasibacillus soli]|uniref:Transposase n=1 Tax=Paracerasibacillus soli TaxID=480284 RepID=A0ABU5CR25_9BACI|nr:hypothetical protein [Virgibacillus soli]MDY0407920.1 hypothetical protein [Virgibacillus soli]